MLTDKLRDLVEASRSTFLPQRSAGASAASVRTSVVALVWDDRLGDAESTRTEGGDAPPMAIPAKGRRGAGKS